MKLYHYTPLSDYLLDYLIEGKLYFSSPLSFNDPFDLDLDCLQVRGRGVSTLTEDYIGALREEAEAASSMVKRLGLRYRELERSERSSMRVANAFELFRNKARVFAEALQAFEEDRRGDSVKRVARSWDRLKRQLVHTYGVRCYSRSPSHILLWSHYADSHRGVCLEFDASERPVQGWKNFRYLPVVYSDTREVDVIGLGFDRAFTRALTTKSSHWAYEDEHRLVTLRGPGVQQGRLAALTGIVLGLRSREWSSDDLKGLLTALARNQKRRSNVPGLKLYLAGKVPGKFAVSITQVSNLGNLERHLLNE